MSRLPPSARCWLSGGAAGGCGTSASRSPGRDFGKSRAKALKDRKNKIPVRQRAGLPQFRKRDKSQPTLNYIRQAFTLRDGRLTLAGSIGVRVVWSRGLPSAPSSVRINRDALGRWHVSFVVETEMQPYPETAGVIGIDWGVKDIAVTTGDAHDLPHPQFGRKSAEKLARYQRQMAGRRPKRGHRSRSGCPRTARRWA